MGFSAFTVAGVLISQHMHWRNCCDKSKGDLKRLIQAVRRVARWRNLAQPNTSASH